MKTTWYPGPLVSLIFNKLNDAEPKLETPIMGKLFRVSRPLTVDREEAR